MNSKTIWAIIIIVIIAGALSWWVKTQRASLQPQAGATADQSAGSGTQLTTLGTYSYECDEHVAMTLTPAGDMQSIAIAPNGATAKFPPTATLIRTAATSGVRFEGSGLVLTAHGETVTLGQGDSAINCSPVPNPDMAPFNFGD